MMNGEVEDARRRRLRWGALLAWSPFVLLVLPAVFDAFRGISEQKATGVGAVAGVFAEAFVSFGFIMAVAFEVTALILLLRTFSKGHSLRSFFSVLSLLCCGVMLFVLGLCLRWYLASVYHHP